MLGADAETVLSAFVRPRQVADGESLRQNDRGRWRDLRPEGLLPFTQSR